jgi:predicted type IV restriction endonuclease
MANIPAVVTKRITASVPKFKKVLEKARERDVNESDTVTIITDILEEVFGFDKYNEITREYAIQGTYCDLAIKTNKKIEYLIEVKAIGIDLKDTHLRQAVNYAAQEGIKWVVLTNGIIWQVYRVTLEGRVNSTKLLEFDFTEINHRKKEDHETLFLLCKRGITKDLIDEFYEYRQSVNRYTIGALIQTEPVVNAIRRELRRFKDGIKVTTQEIQELISNEVLKRDLVESDTAKETQKNIQRLLKKRGKSNINAAKKAIKTEINEAS